MYKIGPLDLLEWIEETPPKLLGQPEILGKIWSVIYLTYLLLSIFAKRCISNEFTKSFYFT